MINVAGFGRALVLCCLSFAVLSSPFSGQSPRELVEDVDGPRTEILVLGTRHLQGVRGFDPAVLDLLLERLEEWGPETILIERLTPRQISEMLADPEGYGGIPEYFLDGDLELGLAAQERLGAEVPAILSEIRTMVDHGIMSSDDRRRLIALLIASWQMDSALIHWRLLDVDARAQGGPLSAEMVEALRARERSVNETVVIAGELASRLAHPLLYPFDDQTDKRDFIADDFIEAMDANGALEQVMTSAAVAELRDGLQLNPETPERMWEEYRFLNSQAYGRLDIRGPWLTFLGVPSEGLGRFRVAMWETRNLMMTAHLRRTIASRPGKRVLAIVGAAHRPWLEAYLREMVDVRVIDFSELAR